MPPRNKNFAIGFSILELCIVMLIIAALLTLAYPSYTMHVIKTHRTEATSGLLNLAEKMEQYYLTHQTYQDASFAELHTESETSHGLYKLVITESDDDTYTIEAIPQNYQTQDKQCDKFIYHQNGTKEITGTSTIKDCW